MKVTALPLILFLTSTPRAGAAPPGSEAYHIVLPRRAIGPGERVELKLSPPAPKGLRVNWWVTSGTKGGIGLNEPGIYRAPFRIPVGTPPVRVGASFSGPDFRASATTDIELVPGSLPGTDDCLGPGQSFSTVLGDIEPGYTYTDELPELIHRVVPEYPKSAFAREIEDTITVHAFVCRSGRVLDAYVAPAFLIIGGEPVERDAKLVEAALAAVRQYIFKPAMVGGQPVAFWIGTGVAVAR